MATKASSMLTIVDITDINLQTYISSNYPTTQIYDSNNDSYAPTWSNLTLSPVIFVNDKAISLTDSSVSITYKRQDGNSAEAALTTGETVSGGKLVVDQNKLSASSSGILTYICYIVYTDPNSKVSVNSKNTLTFSLVKQGGNAHTVSIDGENIFKYNKNGALTGAAQIALNANVQNVTIQNWQYKNDSGAWTDYPTTADNATITGSTLVVKPAHAVFVNAVATIKVLTNDENCYDIITITKLYDGATGNAGVSAINVIMSNEAEVFPTNASGSVTPAKTVIFTISAYQGTTAIKPTVTPPIAPPSGMTITQSTSENTEKVTLTVVNNATLGSTSAMSGSLDFSIAAGGQTFTKTFSWSKSPKGAAGEPGSPGAPGADAIIFECVLNGSNVISEGVGTVPISTVFYKGTSQVTTDITYKWAKYASNDWQVISGATSSSYTVKANDVISATTFRCEATYGGKTYYSYCTVIDKTDPYSCELFSSVGLQLKNSEGAGAIYCKVWQNGTEVDSLKTTTVSTTAPSSPSSEDFYYKINKTAKTVTLMKYTGSSWATASGSDLPSLKYNWSCIDKNGNPCSTPTSWGTGKAIYIDSSIVNDKISIIVEVE